MKIAVIGLGDIAVKAYLPVLTQRDGIELVFCTRNAHRLKQLANTHRITEFCTDYKMLLSHQSTNGRRGIDAVMIHSATSSHYEIAQFFLSHGIPVFVDKPLSDSYQECEALYEIAEQQKQPLFMGFNRRYIPLYNTYLDGVQLHESEQFSSSPKLSLMSLRWEKNRHNLPGGIRTFIFDDFIHPLDSINVATNVTENDLHLVTQFDANQLARLDVQWQKDHTIYHASMNRTFGVTKEKVSANYRNTSYEFDSFVSGTKWDGGNEQRIYLPDWTPMLTSKGFTGMIEHWISVIEQGKQASYLVDRNLKTHYLCDHICQKIEAMKQ